MLESTVSTSLAPLLDTFLMEQTTTQAAPNDKKEGDLGYDVYAKRSAKARPPSMSLSQSFTVGGQGVTRTVGAIGWPWTSATRIKGAGPLGVITTVVVASIGLATTVVRNGVLAGTPHVLNRLTYASTLSHLRRLNSPIGREETPKGQALESSRISECSGIREPRQGKRDSTRARPLRTFSSLASIDSTLNKADENPKPYSGTM
ncbi:hypothetical protein CY35_11G094000 [Sphagnum magellanicum]|nr:hypothetical protein CY35_11G094000 [Sphagnum magellanicum]